MEINADITGNRIRERRKDQKIPQKVLAELAGVSPSAINQYEKGEKVPSTSTLLKLAEALDVTTDYLLGASNKDEVFIDNKAADVFNEFLMLNKRDRMQIMSNISFLRDQARKNPFRKK